MKTKTKDICIFDPGSIELAFTGKISKNTLPAVREAWTNWLASFDAKNLETDQDFTDAAKFVTECKRVEERLDGIRESALKGDVFKAIKELEEMKETTRQKRLEFDRAVTARRADIRTNAINLAMDQLEAALATLPHHRQTRNQAEEPSSMLLLAIKGKSAMLKMQEALETESARILSEAKKYSDRFTELEKKVSNLYDESHETLTGSEMEMLVKTHFEDAPERAKFILQQKKVARDQAELDKQKAKPEPASAPQAPAASATKAASARAIRFGVTFDCTDAEETARALVAMGGRNVKFQLANENGGTK